MVVEEVVVGGGSSGSFLGWTNPRHTLITLEICSLCCKVVFVLLFLDTSWIHVSNILNVLFMCLHGTQPIHFGHTIYTF